MFKKKRRKSNFLISNKKQSYSNGRLRATLVPSAALRERLSERRGEGAAKSWTTKSFFGKEQAVWVGRMALAVEVSEWVSASSAGHF